MLPLVILPMMVVVGVWLISRTQFLGPGRCVNVTGWKFKSIASAARAQPDPEQHRNVLLSNGLPRNNIEGGGECYASEPEQTPHN